MQQYLSDLKEQYPGVYFLFEHFTNHYTVIKTLLAGYTTQNSQRKYNAKNTNPKWRTWFNFYQCWIADSFLRAKSPKAIRQTTLLVSGYMLLGNVSEPCWRVLQRLKIVVSKEVVEKWIKQHPKDVSSTDSFLIYTFDNCDFKVVIVLHCILLLFNLAACYKSEKWSQNQVFAYNQ